MGAAGLLDLVLFLTAVAGVWGCAAKLLELDRADWADWAADGAPGERPAAAIRVGTTTKVPVAVSTPPVAIEPVAEERLTA
jgi:hypothetical protein